MGPLYHLVDETDRTMAVKSAFERLKPGGVVFCNDALQVRCYWET